MGPCLEWPNYRSKKGYGDLYLGRKPYRVHRVSYCDFHGLPIDSIKGLVIRHKCDNPACFNPEHLEIGSVADNSRDMVERGRSLKGEKNRNSTLTEDAVRDIRRNYKKSSRSSGLAFFAKKYGVGKTTVESALKSKMWKHVK